MSEFNVSQQKAIDASVDRNLGLPAGAGSGKTKTLSFKVNKEVKDGNLLPSEMLVLTFTNNAAHEMKERIVATFDDSDPLKAMMLSAHIQTFDSFSAYLVKKYAARLGVSDQLALAADTVIQTKEQEYLDEIFDEYYSSPVLKERIVETLKHFSTSDDARVKLIILDLKRQLDKMLPLKREEYIKDYKDNYLSHDFYKNCLDKYVSYVKEEIVAKIRKTYIAYKYYDDLQEDKIRTLNRVFNNKSNFDYDIKIYGFIEDEVYELYEKYINVLSLDGEEFIKACQDLIFEADEGKYKLRKRAKNEEPIEPRAKDAHSVLLKYLTNKNDSLKALVTGFDFTDDFEYKKLAYFSEDISLFFEIINKLDKKLDDYKRISNTFTFQDISKMALSLVTLPEYEEEAKEIRNQFKFIMVDEYQDTNDFQETFINSLLLPKDDGTKSHLFFVGDAKQAIYGFRNSKVELFRNRQKDYEDPSNKESDVIVMNLNYRSGPGLLKDINYICKNYMTLEHGSINFMDPGEQLMYDTSVNPYKEPYDDFHIKRLLPKVKGDLGEFNEKDWEIRAIINDIKTKIASGYQVYQKFKGLRPCRLNDFAILVRVKGGYENYVKAFKEAGIPLNNKIDVNLSEIDPILVLGSLIDYVCYKKYGGSEYNPKHLFASIARSYLFQYDDNKIFDLISYPDNSLIDNDLITLMVNDFIKENEDSTLSETFNNLLTKFGVIDSLYLLRNVDDVVAKIESLHAIILGQEAAGDNLKDFSNFLKSSSKHKLELKSDSVFAIEDAVDLMTIHASKGLERKIVYLPYSYNRLAGGSNKNKPDYTFSNEYGIILPYYNFDIHNVDEDGNVKDTYAKTLTRRLFDLSNEEDKAEIDEHVRLFYVALTRAENTLYIVGDMFHNEETCLRKENLYGMLLTCPHYERIDNDFLNEKLLENYINSESYNKYLNFVNMTKDLRKSFLPSDFDNSLDYRIYSYLYNDIYKYSVEEEMIKSVISLQLELYKTYIENLEDNQDDYDLISRVYATYRKIKGINNYSDLEIEILKGKFDHNEILGDSIQPIYVPYTVCESGSKDTIQDLKTELDTFIDAALNLNYIYFHAKNENDFVFKFFYVLLQVFDNRTSFSDISFETDEYQDIIERFDINTFVLSSLNKKDSPREYEVDNTKIEFEVRDNRRASKKDFSDEDRPTQEVLERGTYLHRLLELVDLNTKDTSFIQDSHDKYLIDRVLSNHIFDKIKSASMVRKEFGYFDVDMSTHGLIDLMFVENGEYYIIDYKSKHVEDDGYVEQLNTYKRNIKKIFSDSEGHIHLYLLSIYDNKLIELK